MEDLFSIARTCKTLHTVVTSEYLWQLKFPRMLKSANLEFKKHPSENYYDSALRLYRVCYRPGVGFDSLPIKTIENRVCNLAIDIGSKTTWIRTAGFFLQRHPSIYLVPNSDTVSPESPQTSKLLGDDMSEDHVPVRKICCLLCKEKENAVLKETKRWASANRLPANTPEADGTIKQDVPVLQGAVAFPGRSLCANTSHPLMREKFKLWSEISYMLKGNNVDHILLHPIQCYSGEEDFKYLEQFIFHLLSKFELMNEVRKEESTLVFCEPYNSDMDIRSRLAKLFIEKLQVSKICFLNKAYAASLLLGRPNGIVIDSGARNTVVTVIIEGKVQQERTQSCPVGGTEIAQRLADAIELSCLKENVYSPSLDSSRVKSRCYLSPNPSLEQRLGNTTKRSVYVRCIRKGSLYKDQLEGIKLSSELFLAPELMYTAMDLIVMIKRALNGVDEEMISELLHCIILTGHNTELKGFPIRLTRDLQAAFPEHSHNVSVVTNGGSHSWDCVTGAMELDNHLPDKFKLQSGNYNPAPGTIMWVTRESYVLKGSALFQ